MVATLNGSLDSQSLNKALFAALNGDAGGFDYESFIVPHIADLLTFIPMFCNDQSG